MNETSVGAENRVWSYLGKFYIGLLIGGVATVLTLLGREAIRYWRSGVDHPPK